MVYIQTSDERIHETHLHFMLLYLGFPFANVHNSFKELNCAVVESCAELFFLLNSAI